MVHQYSNDCIDDKWSTGKIIAVIAGCVVGVIILSTLTIFFCCKCGCCCCKRKRNRRRESVSSKDYYRHYGGNKVYNSYKNYADNQDLDIVYSSRVTGPVMPAQMPEQQAQVQNQTVAQTEPITPQAYHGALENILNPVASTVIEPEVKGKKQKAEEKKKKKDKKRRSSTYSSYSDYSKRFDETILSAEALAAKRNPREPKVIVVPPDLQPLRPTFYDADLQQQQQQKNTPATQYALLNNNYIQQGSNAPIIVADVSNGVDNNRKFLPHLNIVVPVNKVPIEDKNNFYMEQYSNKNDATNNYYPSQANYPQRLGTLPGAQPLPGMANSTEYTNVYNKKLPRYD
uniref:Uncharacterized protein n=1 Tax=Syphacia muris TaxID=451379 RepID=A0A0N5ANM8_9BILA